MKDLLEILSMRRPHGGANERGVFEKYLKPLGVRQLHQAIPLAYVLEVGITAPKTLFVSHLDTVHRDELTHNQVYYDEAKQEAFKMDDVPLGADDGAGVWLMIQMIKAKVPGAYLFTCGEERGGIGAKWMADNASEWLATFDRAVSFDRKGTGDVITHQGWGERCCSDEFAAALGEALSGHPELLYLPDDSGVYTDTAEFTELIPECSNISVGYANEHSAKETLDVGHLKKLVDQCCKIDWETLPTRRDPSIVEDKWAGLNYGYMGDTVDVEDLVDMTDDDIYDMCCDDPDAAFDLLVRIRDDRRAENGAEIHEFISGGEGDLLDETEGFYGRYPV